MPAFTYLPFLSRKTLIFPTMHHLIYIGLVVDWLGFGIQTTMCVVSGWFAGLPSKNSSLCCTSHTRAFPPYPVSLSCYYSIHALLENRMENRNRQEQTDKTDPNHPLPFLHHCVFRQGLGALRQADLQRSFFAQGEAVEAGGGCLLRGWFR